MSQNRHFSFRRFERASTSLLDEAEMVDHLQKAIDHFTVHLGVLNAVRPGQTDFVPHYAFSKVKLEKYGSLVISDGPNDPYINELSLAEINQLIDVDRAALDHIETRQPIKDVEMVYVEKRATGIIWLYRAQISDPTVCPKCEEALNGMILEDHLRHPSCRNNVRNKELEANGLFLVDEEDSINALIKTRNIDLQYFASDFQMWVPRWVEGAIFAYNKNKNGGAYGGLELHEFLDKMAPIKE